MQDGGGTSNMGVVYELSPSSGGTWTEKILHSFSGQPDHGSNPGTGALILDAAGNGYGTTPGGGTSSAGVVYEITP